MKIGVSLGTALVLLAALLLSSCSGEDASEGTTKEQVQLEVEPAVSSEPEGFRRVAGPGYTLAAPPGFQVTRNRAASGTMVVTVQKVSSGAAVPQKVYVFRETSPWGSAAERADGHLRALTADGVEATLSLVEVNNATEPGYLVSWREPASSNGPDVETAHQLLRLQVSDRVALDVVASAPAAEFDASPVPTIVRTLTPSRK